MDLIFGSSPGLTAIALRGDEVEEGSGSDGEQEGFDDDEEWSQDEWFVSTDGESESGSVDDESVSSWEVSDSRKAEVNTDESGDADGEWNVDLDVLSATPTIGSKRNLKIEDVIASYPAWLQSEREKVTAEEEKKYVIFCDLDGVLVDFEAGVQKIFKKKKTAGVIQCTTQYGAVQCSAIQTTIGSLYTFFFLPFSLSPLSLFLFLCYVFRLPFFLSFSSRNYEHLNIIVLCRCT